MAINRLAQEGRLGELCCVVVGASWGSGLAGGGGAGGGGTSMPGCLLACLSVESAAIPTQLQTLPCPIPHPDERAALVPDGDGTQPLSTLSLRLPITTPCR